MTEIQNHYLTTTGNHEPLVTIMGGIAKTDSINIAELFGKRPDNVNRDIENLIKKGVLNFEEIYVPDLYNRPRKAYAMDRTGFTLLAMGFTGDKALEFKIRYIRAFDAMEDALRGPKKISRVMHGTAFKDDVRFLKAGVQVGTLAGLSKIQALLKANQATIKECGRDCLASIGMKCLPVPENEADYVPSDLGRKLGGQSGRAVNALLEKAGLQEKFRTHNGKIQWQPTERGKAYATIKDG